MTEMSLLCKMGGRLITLWEPFSCDNTVPGAVSRVGSRGRPLPLALTLKESVTLEGAVPREGRWSSYQRQARSQWEDVNAWSTVRMGEQAILRREGGWWESVWPILGTGSSTKVQNQDFFPAACVTFVCLLGIPPGFCTIYLKIPTPNQGKGFYFPC